MMTISIRMMYLYVTSAAISLPTMTRVLQTTPETAMEEEIKL